MLTNDACMDARNHARTRRNGGSQRLEEQRQCRTPAGRNKEISRPCSKVVHPPPRMVSDNDDVVGDARHQIKSMINSITAADLCGTTLTEETIRQRCNEYRFRDLVVTSADASRQFRANADGSRVPETQSANVADDAHHDDGPGSRRVPSPRRGANHREEITGVRVTFSVESAPSTTVLEVSPPTPASKSSFPATDVSPGSESDYSSQASPSDT